MRRLTLSLGLSLLAAAATSTPAHAGTAVAGRIYICQSIDNQVFEIPFTWDGQSKFQTSTPRLIVDLPTGAGCELVDNNTALIVAGQGLFCGLCAYKVNIATGAYEVINAGNNNNAVSVLPGGAQAYLGWFDTGLALVNVSPFAPVKVYPVTGDDSGITQVAFTPAGTFYTSGGTSSGAFGRVAFGTNAVTTRTITTVPATGVLYDPFSATMLVSGYSVITQVAPAAPSTIVSSFSKPFPAFLALSQTGLGHVIGTYAEYLCIVDYSESGRVGDASTKFVQIPTTIANMSGQPAVVVDAILCPSDFNHDGFVTGDDFDLYVDAFTAGNIAADFDGNGFVTGDDFDTFVLAFEAGC